MCVGGSTSGPLAILGKAGLFASNTPDMPPLPPSPPPPPPPAAETAELDKPTGLARSRLISSRLGLSQLRIRRLNAPR